MRRGILVLTIAFLWSGLAEAKPVAPKDLLIKLKNPESISTFTIMAQDGGAKVETLGSDQWLRVTLKDQQLQHLTLDQIRANPNVAFAQPNYPLRFPEDYRTDDQVVRRKLIEWMEKNPERAAALMGSRKDNPPFPTKAVGGSGNDPLLAKQWGMKDIGAEAGWKKGRGAPVIVAVIDTGVEYTHPDLVDNMWRNPGESGIDASGRDKSSNGVDDDGNGYVDDLMGWDFANNDNMPFDRTVGPLGVLLNGGNPGHGTHCAGNVAARGGNGRGIAGAAPEAKIMALRFLGERGGGTTADAVKAIRYAVDNGAKVLSNSWGSIGEGSPADGGNLALREAIQYSMDKGTLFIAASGNGFRGRGYDNDTAADNKTYPASYDFENIISVAAIDNKDRLGSFSNFGAKTVDIGAPGVKVFSTVGRGRYSDTVINIVGIIKATWDGTSMATPHVAGAAAAYWSANPRADWREVKAAILDSAQPTPALRGKVSSNGKLNLEALMSR